VSRARARERVKLRFAVVDPMTREFEVLLGEQVIGRVRRLEPFSVSPWPRRRVRGWVILDPDDVGDIVWPTRRVAARALRRLHEELSAAASDSVDDVKPGPAHEP
jgi:hypothetical protein